MAKNEPPKDPKDQEPQEPPKDQQPPAPPAPEKPRTTNADAQALAQRVRRATPWARGANGAIVTGLEVLGIDPATPDRGAAVRVEGPRGEIWTIDDAGDFEAYLAAQKK